MIQKRMWLVTDFVDAIGLIVVTRQRLLDPFVKKGKEQLSLRELMEMCLDPPWKGAISCGHRS